MSLKGELQDGTQCRVATAETKRAQEIMIILTVPVKTGVTLFKSVRIVLQVTSSGSKSYSGQLEAEASATITATSSIGAQWPSVSLSGTTSGRNRTYTSYILR